LLQTEYRELADEYTRAVEAFFGDQLVSVAFFGSVARGEATLESDLDVLVVALNLTRDIGLRFRETMSVHDRVKRGEAYRRLRGQGRSAFVSDLFLSPEEVRGHPPILLDLTDDAHIAYDKNNFLESVLKDIRRRLKELKAKKVKTSKGYYWVLKPDAKTTEVVVV
jgi:predicted nucleotidyltransferase